MLNVDLKHLALQTASLLLGLSKNSRTRRYLWFKSLLVRVATNRGCLLKLKLAFRRVNIGFLAFFTSHVLCTHMTTGLDCINIGHFNHHISPVIIWMTPFCIDFGKEHVFKIFNSH